MGFYVDENNKVWADHAIKEFGDTTADNNPTFDTTYCDAWPMRVTSVFKRFKFEGKGKPVGDNCPFIYGVKRKQGLSVGFHGVAPLISPLATILAKFAADCVARGATFDAVLPMPSSHKIAAILAKRAGMILGAPIIDSLFHKATSDEIRYAVDNSDIPHAAKVNILNAVTKAIETDTAFSLSDVRTHFRKYISPVTLVAPDLQYRSILLVDDLFASGQTLIAAKNALYSSIRGLQTVESLCLFSPVNGRIHKQRR